MTLAAMASLHVLRPDLNPITQVMSYYGPGPYGFLFTISLAALGIGLAALTALLRRGLAPEERSAVTLSFVAIAATSAFAVAIFDADLPGAPHTLHGSCTAWAPCSSGPRFPWRQSTCPAVSVSTRRGERRGACRSPSGLSRSSSWCCRWRCRHWAA
jgi:hypothetical protein